MACSDAGERADALPHLPRRLVGECHGQNFMGAGASGGDEMRDPGGEHPRLADARRRPERGPARRAPRPRDAARSSVHRDRTDRRARDGSGPAMQRRGERRESAAGSDVSGCWATNANHAPQPSGATQDANLQGHDHRHAKPAGTALLSNARQFSRPPVGSAPGGCAPFGKCGATILRKPRREHAPISPGEARAPPARLRRLPLFQ